MRWLKNLRQQVEFTNPVFAALKPSGWPIPFFGDIRTARVLTVGVNPSTTEFNPTRWGQITNDAQWTERLLNYFHVPGIPWHKWFLPWEASLRLLGCSYEDGSAAHLDLSPRSTTVMSQAHRNKFCEMVAGDVHWLFESLKFAPKARLILAAGTMIKPATMSWDSVGDYLEQKARRLRIHIKEDSLGRCLISKTGQVSLRIYSFPKGPSAQNKFNLVEGVFAAREKLLPILR